MISPIWVVVSFMCTASGCDPMPRVDFKPGTPAENCRQLRDAMVRPWGAAMWVEAHCAMVEESQD